VIGQTLAHYRITAAIGAGGMGEVCRATDTKLGRDVALKILPAEMAASPERLERFQREAKAVAALNHPHIVTIHSVEEADGVHFLTMELVEGQPLDKLVAAGALSVERIVEIGTAIADALAAAHEKGIVHRDLKPANVVVSEGGGVKVLDFGLAKIRPPGDSTSSELPTEARTRDGVVMGTIPYMSPEQVSGRPADHRTDVFSLGVVLYEMASGRRPFRGDSTAELASAILRDTPAAVTDLRPELPADLVRIIRRCLEKDTRQRFQTARDVGNELRDMHRHPTPRSGSAAVAIAVLPFADMSPGNDQDYLCEGMAEEIMNALVRIPGIRVASRTSAFRASQNEKDLAAIGRVLSVDHILEGSVRTAGSRLRATAQLSDVASGYQLWSERFDRALEDVFAVQDEIAAGVVDAVKARLRSGEHAVPARPQVKNLEAYRHYLKGRFLRHTKNDHAGALKEYEEAVRLDSSHGLSWVGVAEVNVLAAHYCLIPTASAYAKAQEALATAAQLQGDSAEALYVEGMLAYVHRRWAARDEAYQHALQLEPSHVQVLGSYGLVLAAHCRLDEAREYFDRAREADPLASFPCAVTGVGLLTGGEPEESLRHFEDALAFEMENTLALWGSGTAHVALRRFDEGLAMLEKAVVHMRRAAFVVGALGWGLAVAGRTEEARTLLQELRSRPQPAPTAVSEAWLLGVLGHKDGAFDVLARAEEERQAFLIYTGLPGFDSLRHDPRFDALLKRIRLAPGGSR
jgi:TolB-like protein/Flp pilus assembly protein TadD